ncbi:MAG: hypothetical protein QOF30_3381 [Acidimicrobiaceae bacterium]|jgi:hypothetical protein|nr:hypothetical protein [Acidimicrobiaceae bacterium]
MRGRTSWVTGGAGGSDGGSASEECQLRLGRSETEGPAGAVAAIEEHARAFAPDGVVKDDMAILAVGVLGWNAVE